MKGHGRISIEVLAIVIFAAGPAAAQVSPGKMEYTARESAAPPHIIQQLSRMRQQVATEKLSFTVGYTTALDRPLSQLAGTRPPANLLQKAKEQNRRAMAVRRAPLEVSPCSATDTLFDWRKFNKVTAVRDQGNCGSCWAFGTLGAFEGSYALGVNALIDAAEQDVLSCSHAGSCNGGWWAFSYLENPGVATDGDFPYTATDAPCHEVPARPFHAVTWGYVSPDAEIPSVRALKQALCEHGPLAVSVNVTSLFQAYTGGVFNEHDPGSINHAITLIGWDDGKNAWLIKNSWGNGWGETGSMGSERGYMWIAFDSNKVGYGAAWVDPVPAPPPIVPPTIPPTPVPGLSVWTVVILAVCLGLAEAFRRSRSKTTRTGT